MSESVQKPDQKYIDLLAFIENRYKCSGLCTPSLFYFTQSVKEGPPKQACLPPFISEVVEPMASLGAAMIASAVFFLFVLLCICSVCCFKPANLDAVKALEGGEFELANQKTVDISQVQNQIANDVSVRRNQV